MYTQTAMIKMLRIITVFLSLLLLSGITGAAEHSVNVEQDQPVKLTILLPLSNIYKDMGIDAKNGFFLGIEQCNEEDCCATSPVAAEEPSVSHRLVVLPVANNE